MALLASSVIAFQGMMASADAQQVGYAPNRILVKFKAGTTNTAANQALGLIRGKVTKSIGRTGVKVITLPSNANAMEAAQRMSANSRVEFAELDYKIQAEASPNDPMFANQWMHTRLQSSLAFDYTAGSSGITIAIIDTGVDSSHPDLSGRMVSGWNFFDNNSNSADVHGHGTAVAGTAAASVNNSTGVAGVAGLCKIMPLRVTDTTGSAYISNIASAITWASDRGARVANASFQASQYGSVQSAAQYFKDRGGVVTISSGNAGQLLSDANPASILTVGATDSSDAVASFSNRGNIVDIAAPGVSVLTTNRGGTYGSWSGTSFSAPCAAGVAALVLSANPALTGEQAYSVMTSAVDDLGTAGWDAGYGFGRVNSYKAVQLALNAGGPDTEAPGLAILSPSFGSILAGSFNFSVSATDNVGVSQVKFYLNNALLGSDTTSPYSIAVNSANYPNGSYQLKAEAYDSTGNWSAEMTNIQIENFLDTQAPYVSLTNPTAGLVFSNSLTVSAGASDNVGVTKVEFWVGGKLRGTDTSAPYAVSLNTKSWKRGTYAVYAKAFDAAGNVASSSSVNVVK